jgi:hypothetical protein
MNDFEERYLFHDDRDSPQEPVKILILKILYAFQNFSSLLHIFEVAFKGNSNSNNFIQKMRAHDFHNIS